MTSMFLKTLFRLGLCLFTVNAACIIFFADSDLGSGRYIAWLTMLLLCLFLPLCRLAIRFFERLEKKEGKQDSATSATRVRNQN
jgi:hypothetical protein